MGILRPKLNIPRGGLTFELKYAKIEDRALEGVGN
jgi:hypothetical protein